MKITVELQSYLDQYSPNGDDARVFAYELPDGATVGDLLRKLHISLELASVIAVADEAADETRALKEGDRVTLVPPIAGG
jgi:molybdopterin converting factor small subunit